MRRCSQVSSLPLTVHFKAALVLCFDFIYHALLNSFGPLNSLPLFCRGDDGPLTQLDRDDMQARHMTSRGMRSFLLREAHSRCNVNIKDECFVEHNLAALLAAKYPGLPHHVITPISDITSLPIPGMDQGTLRTCPWWSSISQKGSIPTHDLPNLAKFQKIPLDVRFILHKTYDGPSHTVALRMMLPESKQQGDTVPSISKFFDATAHAWKLVVRTHLAGTCSVDANPVGLCIVNSHVLGMCDRGYDIVVASDTHLAKYGLFKAKDGQTKFRMNHLQTYFAVFYADKVEVIAVRSFVNWNEDTKACWMGAELTSWRAPYTRFVLERLQNTFLDMAVVAKTIFGSTMSDDCTREVNWTVFRGNMSNCTGQIPGYAPKKNEQGLNVLSTKDILHIVRNRCEQKQLWLVLEDTEAFLAIFAWRGVAERGTWEAAGQQEERAFPASTSLLPMIRERFEDFDRVTFSFVETNPSVSVNCELPLIVGMKGGDPKEGKGYLAREQQDQVLLPLGGKYDSKIRVGARFVRWLSGDYSNSSMSLQHQEFLASLWDPSFKMGRVVCGSSFKTWKDLCNRCRESLLHMSRASESQIQVFESDVLVETHNLGGGTYMKADHSRVQGYIAIGADGRAHIRFVKMSQRFSDSPYANMQSRVFVDMFVTQCKTLDAAVYMQRHINDALKFLPVASGDNQPAFKWTCIRQGVHNPAPESTVVLPGKLGCECSQEAILQAMVDFKHGGMSVLANAAAVAQSSLAGKRAADTPAAATTAAGENSRSSGKRQKMKANVKTGFGA